MQREQKQRRENHVTMYRKYRIGDLPDIQIKHTYVIAPLQALAQVCAKIFLFHVKFVKGCVGLFSARQHRGASFVWRSFQLDLRAVGGGQDGA